MALVVLCASTLMIILDQTIVNVALPSVQSDLGFSQAGLAWVVNAYLIPFGGLLLLAGRLGDLVGRRRVFLAGLATFTVASLLCGLAWNQWTLVIARFVQGVGGALSSAVTLGMIVTIFAEPGERARAIGVFSFVGAAGASIGVLAGGVLTQLLTWHWIFFVNVPIGVLAGAVAVRVLAPDRGRGLGAGADALGAVLVTAALMLGVYTVVETPSRGWGSAHTIGFGTVAVVLLGGFVVREAFARDPLLPLRIFRSRDVSSANAAQALLIAGAMGFQFLAALYLQRVLGFGPARVGLAFLPIAATIGIVSLLVSPRLITRYGARPVLLVGLVLVAAALAMLTRAPAGGHYVADLLPAFALLGIGAGLALPSVVTLALAGVPADAAGLASGLVNTTQQVGAVLGISVLATLASTRTGVAGYHLGFGAGAVSTLAAVVATLAAVVAARASATRAADATSDTAPAPRKTVTTG
jgi:EmrB/QacA subfamily drug resistance transporter